jgi:hypothetical protein
MCIDITFGSARTYQRRRDDRRVRERRKKKEERTIPSVYSDREREWAPVAYRDAQRPHTGNKDRERD